MYDVISVDLPNFKGFVAVGKGLRKIFNPLVNYIPSAIILTSTDGITWTASPMPSTQNWTAITFGNGKFVTIASNTNVVCTTI